jgi:hypothetical protein
VKQEETTGWGETTFEEGGERQDGPPQRRRTYEAPRLVPYGHVKELTADAKPGRSDFTTHGRIV